MVWLALGFVFLLALRVPVAFALFISTTVYCIGTDLLPAASIGSLAVNGVGNFLLVTIPTYILMAELMNRSTITQRIFNFATALVGHLPGGLAHVNVIGSLIFAGMSGSSNADIAGLGRIEVKMMEKQGYPRSFGAACTIASATLGPILPPSIIMVVFAASAEESIARMFLGGVVPAFIIAASLMVTIFFICLRHRDWGQKAQITWGERIRSFWQAVPALLTPIILLMGTVTGYWTPTEAGAAASIYAFVVAKFLYRDLKWPDVSLALQRTAISTGNILLIFSAAHILSRIVALEGTPAAVAEYLQVLTQNPYAVLILINTYFFIGGMFIEPTPFLLVSTPIVMKVAELYGLNLVHLGVVSVVNLMLGTITPPFAIGLFVMSDAVYVPFHQLVRATLPFYIPFIVVLAIISFIPITVLWLPNLLLGSP